jgi:hypothetical protein
MNGDLVRARFWGRRPKLSSTGSEVHVSYPRWGPLGWVRYALQQERAALALHPSPTWTLRFKGGIHRLSADLRDLLVAGIEIRGGISQVELWLPRPSGTLRVLADSSAAGIRIHLPAATPLRLSISGAVASLDIGNEQLGAVGTGVRRETPDWRAAPDRFDLVVSGSVQHLEIT